MWQGMANKRVCYKLLTGSPIKRVDSYLGNVHAFSTEQFSREQSAGMARRFLVADVKRTRTTPRSPLHAVFVDFKEHCDSTLRDRVMVTQAKAGASMNVSLITNKVFLQRFYWRT